MHTHRKTQLQPSVPAKSAQRRQPVTPLSAATGIMQLQRTIGNRAVGRLFSSQAPVIQRKVIGTLGDYSVLDTKYENDNENVLVNHMGGEWNGNNGGAVRAGICSPRWSRRGERRSTTRSTICVKWTEPACTSPGARACPPIFRISSSNFIWAKQATEGRRCPN